MKKVVCIAFIILLIEGFRNGNVQHRTEFLLEKNWKFTREDPAGAMQSNFDDSRWQTVTVPHDWAIYGPFNANNDLKKMAIVQDG